MCRVAGQSSREDSVKMEPEIDPARVDEPSAENDVEATLREVRAFLDNPVALLERAVALLSERAAESSTR